MDNDLKKQLKKERYINFLLLHKIEAMQELLHAQELLNEGLMRNYNGDK